MRKTIVTIAACATLLWTGVARATPSAQQSCDNARIAAWAKYVSCVDAVVAKDAKGVSFDESSAFAKCRHAYFKTWDKFQTKAALATSTCVGDRFADSGTTETDNLTGLVWEKKTNDSTVHDKDNYYSWSTGSPYNGNGTAFATFLTGATTGLNVAGFAGAKDWRLPTLAELQTIVADFACTGAFGESKCQCGSNPCVALDAANTQSDLYWSATGYAPDPTFAWFVGFNYGDANDYNFNGLGKELSYYVRAVRGGL